MRLPTLTTSCAIVLFLSALAVLAGGPVAAARATAGEPQPVEDRPGAITPSKLFEGVIYRLPPQQRRARIITSGNLTVGADAIVFESRKIHLTIPTASIRRVRMTRLPDDPFFTWIVVEYDEDSGYRAAAFRDAGGLGRRQTGEIAATLEAAARTAKNAPGGVPVPQETVGFDFDGRSWKLGYQKEADDRVISEYVLPGETVEGWTEIVTLQSFPGAQHSQTPSGLAGEFKGRLLKNCPGALWTVLDETPDGVLYEWRTKGCRGWDDQYEVARFLKGGSALYRLAYTTRTLPLGEEKRGRWVALIRAARTGVESGMGVRADAGGAPASGAAALVTQAPPEPAPPSPAAQPQGETTEMESVPYEGMKDQFTIAIPKSWHAHDQSASSGRPGQFGVIVFSQVSLQAIPLAPDKDPVEEAARFMDRFESGEIPSFFVDRHPAELGMACDGFTEKGRKRALQIYQSPIALGKRSKVIGTPEVEAAAVGGCQGLRVRMRVRDASGGELGVLIYAVSDGRTVYDFSLRNRNEFFDRNLPAFEKAVSTIRLTAWW